MEIPLFPLRTVLCPGIALPLHVFEPRYRLMTERCVEGSSPFGIVLIREGSETGPGNVALAGIGTMAEIREATRRPDGRYDLLVVGTGRFAIEEVDAEREPYLLGRVVVLDEDVGDVDRSTTLAARAMRRFVSYLHLLQPMEGETAEEIDVRVEIETSGEGSEPEVGEVVVELEIEPEPSASPSQSAASAGTGAVAEPEPGPEAASESADAAEARREKRQLNEAARRLLIPDDPTTLSYLLSGIIQIDPPRRQRLLEAATTEERLKLLDELIDRELWMLRRRLRFYTPDVRGAAVRRS